MGNIPSCQEEKNLDSEASYELKIDANDFRVDCAKAMRRFRKQIRVDKEFRKRRYDTLNRNLSGESRRSTLSILRRNRDALLSGIGLDSPISVDDTVRGFRLEISKLQGITLILTQKEQSPKV